MKEILSKKFDIDKIIEGVGCIILFIWCITPFLYEFYPTSHIIERYKFILLIIIGTIGVPVFLYYILKGMEKKENRNDFVKTNFPLFLFIIYMLWTWISCLLAKNITKAFLGDGYRKEGWFMYVVYGSIFTCAFFTKSKKFKELIINTFLIVMILDIVLLNFTNRGRFFRTFLPADIKVSTFPNSNHYGYYLLLGTIISFMQCIIHKNKCLKVVYLSAYCILLHNLIINNTFGCYLALGVTLIMLIIINIIKKQKVILSIVGLSIFIIMSIFVRYNKVNIVKNNFLSLYKNYLLLKDKKEKENKILDKQDRKEEGNKILDKNDKEEEEDEILDKKDREDEEDKILAKVGSGRGRLWKYGIKFILKKPILGYGADNLGVEYASKNISQDRPHNIIIQLATTSGLIGLFLYTGAVGIIIVKGYKKINSENSTSKVYFFAIIAYFISAMFGNSTVLTSPYLYILLGFLMDENLNYKEVCNTNKNFLEEKEHNTKYYDTRKILEKG